jgi:hypothetical protein
MAYLDSIRTRVRINAGAKTAVVAACALLTSVQVAQAQAPATSAPAMSASATVALPPPPAMSAEVTAPAVSTTPVETAPAVSAAPELPPAPAASEPAVSEPPISEVPPELAPEEPPPVNEPESESSLSLGVAMRSGLAVGLSGPTEGQLSLNDGLVDQIQIRPSLAGKINEHIGFFTQFEIGTPKGLGTFAILDAIAQIRVVDEFQVWIGQHIPANDRNNNNGPFFGNTWNFAIDTGGYPFDVGARDRGATFWGLIAGGRLKYHASIVDLQPGREISEARYAGRLTLHLLEPEAFYYNSGTYWGTKDVLAIGAVAQGQQGPEGTPNTDFAAFSFDAFFEKNTGGSGTFTLEAGYWNFESSEVAYVQNQGTVDNGIGVNGGPYGGSAYMGVVSWLTPDKVGPGQIQPNFRIQYLDAPATQNTTIDLGVTYVIDGFNHKYHLNYRHKDVDPSAGGGMSEDILQFGLQYMLSM